MKMEVTDKELDVVYDTIHALKDHESWEILDDLFSYWELKAWRIPLDLLLAYATASLGIKSKIPSRERFIKKCMELYPDKELWRGLE